MKRQAFSLVFFATCVPHHSLATTIQKCPTIETTSTTPDGLQWLVCPNSDYQAPSISITSSVDTLSACIQLCDQYGSGCTNAVYDNVHFVCHIKGNSSSLTWVTSTQYSTFRLGQSLTPGTTLSSCPTGGYQYTLSPGSVWEICPFTDFQGNTLSANYQVSTTEACTALCASTTGCVRAVYNATQQVCYLKDQSSSQFVWNPQYETIQFSTQASSAFTKPVMGFNSYNFVACSPTQTNMEGAMTALHEQGFIDLGYTMFQIDCGWQSYQRQSNGSITYDATAFPLGMSYLSQKAIGLGFSWGMYTDQGVQACDTTTPRPGSLGYEKQDASQFAAWNTVYVKVDNCYATAGNTAPKAPDPTLVSRYTTMYQALAGVGINGLLVCEWGVPWPAPNGTLEGPAQWTRPLSTSFRLADDISGGYFDVYRIMNQAIYVNSLGWSGNGNHADLDLLEVGNNYMSADEEATHFAIWSMFKSALMISTNPSTLSVAATATLKNEDLIAINQDELGKPVTLVQRYPDHDLFAGPLANGDQAVLLIDQTGQANNMTVDFQKLGVGSATVRNLWTGVVTNGVSSYTGSVNGHGSLPLRLSNIKSYSVPTYTINWISASSGTLSGGAGVQNCPGCSDSESVGLISSNGGQLTLQGINTSQETQDVLFDYLNCDIAYGFQTTNPNARGVSISVNGGSAVNISMPVSGYNWGTDVFKNFKVELSGFNTDGTNTVTITGDSAVSAWAPDFDRIGFVG